MFSFFRKQKKPVFTATIKPTHPREFDEWICRVGTYYLKGNPDTWLRNQRFPRQINEDDRQFFFSYRGGFITVQAQFIPQSLLFGRGGTKVSDAEGLLRVYEPKELKKIGYPPTDTLHVGFIYIPRESIWSGRTV